MSDDPKLENHQPPWLRPNPPAMNPLHASGAEAKAPAATPTDPTLEELRAVYGVLTEIARVLTRIEKHLAQVDADNKRTIARLEERKS